MSLNLSKIEAQLQEIEFTYPGAKPVARKYIEQAKVGNDIADFIINSAKPPKELKEPKKQLTDASKQLKKLRKDILESVDELGFETAPKHLWSVIQLIQQSQHMYVASGPNKNDQQVWEAMTLFIRSVPSVWSIANAIDALAEQKRKLSGQIVNNKV